VIDFRPELANASDSMRINRESFSNEIDEREWQFEKHAEQRISILKGIAMSWRQPKHWISFEREESRMDDESTRKSEFSASIEMEI
jgi:hypothetical protein